MTFSAESVRSNTKVCLRRPYRGEIDCFAVYCPENRGVYVVPCADSTPGHVTLRITPPVNSQCKRVRWAADYELGGFEP